MERLIDLSELQKILESGLITGKWSVQQFNGCSYWREIKPTNKERVLPTSEFLKANPQFLDQNFRDLSEYERANHRRVV